MRARICHGWLAFPAGGGLEALYTAAFEADARWERVSDINEHMWARTRLTCAGAASQALASQVSPKREDLSSCRELIRTTRTAHRAASPIQLSTC